MHGFAAVRDVSPGLRTLFSPDRVAVVGASGKPGSVGRAIVENLEGFEGDVALVNPNRDRILERPCYPDVASVPDPVDLAVVAVPPPVVADAVREAATAGVGHVVVITAGFGEAGPEGAKREQELRQVAETHDLAVVGPNSLGVMGTGRSLNATFGPAAPLPGSISFMSQSGAFVTAAVDWASDHGVGFRDVVSLGNKAVLDETDFLRAWDDDPGTNVVLGYLESIDGGREFLEAAREVTTETPVVVVKSGRTDAGAQAASSHTGAIAGSERAYEAGLEQAGVVRAESVGELFDVAESLDALPVPDGNGVAIVTNAGGPGVMTTDAVGDSSLSVAALSRETREALTEALPDGANTHNPVDVIGDADVDRFETALRTVVHDDAVDAVIVVACPTAVLDFESLAATLEEVRDEFDLALASCLMGGARARAAGMALSDAGVPSFFDPSRAVRSLDALERYRQVRERTYREPTEFDVDREAARAVLERAADRGTPRLGVEAMDLLDAYGIPTPDGTIADSSAAAVSAAERIGGPVVMKIVSPDILHKSDIGGVRTDVAEADVADVYDDLVTRARNYQPDATVLGVQVQEQVDLDSGTETIVGANRDPQFGPLLLFGLGGVFVEVLEDTSVRVGPISEREATEMVAEIDAAPLLRGARGREPVDRDAVVETLQRLSQLVTDFPEILELDVNPLVATPDGVVAVDLRLTVDQDQ